jgi:hypothetical protein
MVKRALRQDARTAPAAPFCHGYDPVTGNLAPEAVKRCGNAPWCSERKAWIVERADVPRSDEARCHRVLGFFRIRWTRNFRSRNRFDLAIIFSGGNDVENRRDIGADCNARVG